MNNLQTHISSYLEYCLAQKRLDEKTIKAYRIDLIQFYNEISISDPCKIAPYDLEKYIEKFFCFFYIEKMHRKYKPKSVRRKIASIKAFFHYLEYKNIILQNPFNKIQIHFREPVILPKTIPLYIVEKFLFTIYKQRSAAKTNYQKRNALRDAAIVELLFSTGIRISELCNLKISDVNLIDGVILIYGKGSKERILQIGNSSVLNILKEYKNDFYNEIVQCNHFFSSQSGKPLSDQSVRRMINKYASLSSIDLHITPHMFRHTFVFCLLEADVEIRYIQEMLGHSSINITQIYTHVAVSKQKDILINKHPRKDFHF